MLRHLLLLIVLSILAVLFLHPIDWVLSILLSLHNILVHFFDSLFSPTSTGRLISHAVSLMLAPVIITALPGFIYWLLTRRELDYVFLIAWTVWVMLVTCLALHA
jgi:hypothetical protein